MSTMSKCHNLIRFPKNQIHMMIMVYWIKLGTYIGHSLYLVMKAEFEDYDCSVKIEEIQNRTLLER